MSVTRLLRTFRMRCAFRYLFVVVVIALVLISINLSVFSEKTLNYFGSNRIFEAAQPENPVAIYGRRGHNFTVKTLQKFITAVTLERLKNKKLSNVVVTWEEYRHDPDAKTGNPLIDDYGKNDMSKPGENGKGVTFTGPEKEKADQLLQKFNVNVYASDKIPLNRMVPDSRFKGCQTRTYPTDLPSASIIIPFYDEWPSILLRTVYSIVNRTPRKLVKEIILVDDGSKMNELKGSLDKYVNTHFPAGLVKIIRQPERRGLIQSRMTGFRNSTGDVLVFFDSHMEVNIDWLQPLLTEIKLDRKTIAMAALDYVQQASLEYKFYDAYMTRYAFDWRLIFFETFFRNDQIGKTPEDTRPGTVMVGAAYAIEKNYFEESGAYDEGMKVWGGENLEMSWRIWLCGGRLVHAPCSHLGHVARAQPYDFPGGRGAVEMYNYKRAIEVWMEPQHKELVYNSFPDMRNMDVGDLTPRIALKEGLQCKPFSWFMQNIWPELHVLSQDVTAWGSARNLNTNKCLDNHSYLFQAPEALFAEQCHYQYAAQGFSMTKDRRLRTSLQCVVVKQEHVNTRPMLEDCIIGPNDTWTHVQGSFIKHDKTGFCLDLDDQGPIMKTCNSSVITQLWQFNDYVIL